MQDKNSKISKQNTEIDLNRRPMVSHVKIHVKTGVLGAEKCCVILTTDILPTSANLNGYTIKVTSDPEISIIQSNWAIDYSSTQNKVKYSKSISYEASSTPPKITVEFTGGTNNGIDTNVGNSYYKGPDSCPSI